MCESVYFGLLDRHWSVVIESGRGVCAQDGRSTKKIS